MCNKIIQSKKAKGGRNAKRMAKQALKKLGQVYSDAKKEFNYTRNKRIIKAEIKRDAFNYKNIANTLHESDVSSRKRWKTLNEREVLEWFFELDSEWTRKTILYLKDLVQLSEKQIYKWGYEKRRRLNLNTNEEKAIDMRLVTNLDDLHNTSGLDDLNNVVDYLFPEQENEEETLSDEQKEVYDAVRNQLVERSMKYELQSDLDKLLNERIPITNIAVEAKTSLEISVRKDVLAGRRRVDGYKKGNEAKEQKLNQKTLFDNFQNVCTRSSAVSTEWRSFGDTITKLNNTPHTTTSCQFGSASKDQCKDSNNLAHAINSESLYDESEISDDFEFSFGLESLFKSRSAPLWNDTISVEHLSNLAISQKLQILDPIANDNEEWQFESLNDLWGSLLDSEEVFISTNN